MDLGVLSDLGKIGCKPVSVVNFTAGLAHRLTMDLRDRHNLTLLSRFFAFDPPSPTDSWPESLLGNLILGKFARDHLQYSTLPAWTIVGPGRFP